LVNFSSLEGTTQESRDFSHERFNKGTDYVLNGEDMTLKANFLAKLTESAELGEVAVMKAQFNKGADWTFHVLYNDTPVLQNVEGTTANFAIPTAFNGDRIATMEAVYAAGATPVRIT
jgi:endoglucanase